MEDKPDWKIKGISSKQVFTQMWRWISDYFTIQQIIAAFGSSGIMSGILTSLLHNFRSLGIVGQIFVGIGLTLIFSALIMFIWSRFIKNTRQKRQKHREWIALNMPHFAELPIILARTNEVITGMANELATRNISYKTIEKCDKYYTEQVKVGLVSKLFSYTETVDIRTARRIWKKTIPKVRKDVKKMIEGMNVFAEAMEKNNIGLYDTIRNDKEYIELSKKLTDLKATTNSVIRSAINIYEDASYGSNMLYMFYTYMQKAMQKKARKERKGIPIEFEKPPQILRMEIDKFLGILLSNVEETIEEGINENNNCRSE